MGMDLEGLFTGLEKLVATRVKEMPGDYYEDGLLHCGKCKTPKQVRIEIFNSVRTPFCLCKCAAAQRDAEEAERKRVEEMERIKNYRRMGFPEADMLGWTFANASGSDKIIATAKKYVDNFSEMQKRGKGLLLYGSVGTGKTYAAACIANAIIDTGVPCLVTNFARLVNTIGGMFEGKQEYIDSLNKFRLLVIDDLASERNTEYMNEHIYNIIDSRYRAGLPLIVTTNLTAEELKRPADISKQRIYSRLFEMCIPVEVSGKDRRREKLKEDYKDLNEMLGLN